MTHQATPLTTTSINDCWNKIGVWGKRDCPELKKVVHCRNCPVYSAAAVQLLDRDLPAGYLEEWTAHFARQQELSELKTKSVVIFRVGHEWLALPTIVLQEVSELRKIHSIPHRRSSMVLGLVNIRGELLVCVSLSKALALEESAETKPAKQLLLQKRLLVVNKDGHRLVFAVDEIHGIRDFHPEEIKEAPSTVAKATATYTKGVLPWQGKSVGCLDEELLFYTLNRSLG